MVKPVNIHLPYVYLDYLQINHPSIWNDAVAAVKSINGEFNSTTAEERILNSITFLNTIAAQQRQNEINFINTKIQELEDKSLDIPELNKIKHDMAQLIYDASTKGFDYQEFSRLLNEVISTENEYKARLTTLLQNMKNQEKRTEKNQGLLIGIEREFSDTLKFLTNGKKALRNNTKDYSKIMPHIIYDYIHDHQKDLKFNSSSELAASLLKIQLDFRRWMESQELLKNPIGEELNDRINFLREKFQNFMRLDEQNTRLSIIDSNEAQKLVKIFNLSNNSKTSNKSIEFSIDSKSFSDITPMMPTVVFNSNIKSNKLAEIISLALNKFKFGRGTGSINMGNDAILGHLTASYKFDNKEMEEKLENTIDEIFEATRTFANARQDRDNYLSNNALMNYEIEEALKKLDQDLNSTATQQKAFIIHESTKYYETLEQESNNRNKSREFLGFRGRSLSILNYIDVMRNIGLDFGVDPDSWYFAALNLGKHSPAKDMRGQLERIFCIAASLIMFDDVSVIAQEAVGTLTFSNVTNLHLYNLQGLYFPASYIIQETAYYLQGISTATNPATVNITVPDNNYKDYADHYTKKERHTKMSNFLKLDSDERWEKMKAIMASQTKVSIHFFLNFQNFISNISKL